MLTIFPIRYLQKKKRNTRKSEKYFMENKALLIIFCVEFTWTACYVNAGRYRCTFWLRSSDQHLQVLTLRLLFHEQGNIQPIVNQYSDPTSDLEATVWEFIITFILMFTICSVATDPRVVRSELHLLLASKIFYINEEKMGLKNRCDVFLLFLLCLFFSPPFHFVLRSNRAKTFLEVQ